METIAKQDSVNLLTLPEAGQILKRRVSTLRKDIAQRRITHVRIGRSIRIPASVVEELISAGWREAIEGGS